MRNEGNPLPEETSWGTLKKYIRQWTEKNRKSHTPLGAWIAPTGKQRIQWPVYQELDKISLLFTQTCTPIKRQQAHS